MSPLRWFYLILAVLGLVVPWWLIVAFLQTNSFAEFMAATAPNPAARAMNLDLFIATLAGSVWMAAEARRLKMKYSWLYILIAFLVVFSFALPLFLFVRQGKLEGPSVSEAGEAA